MSKSAACVEWMNSNLEIAQSSTIEQLAQAIESDMGFQVSRLYLRQLRIKAGITSTRSRGNGSGGTKTGSSASKISEQIAIVTSDVSRVYECVKDVSSNYRDMVYAIGDMSQIMSDMRTTINVMEAEMAAIKASKKKTVKAETATD